MISRERGVNSNRIYMTTFKHCLITAIRQETLHKRLNPEIKIRHKREAG